MKRLLPLLLLCTSSVGFAAEFAFINDQIKVSLRSDQGDKFHYVSTVDAGTRVEVLTRGDDFSLVRDPKGKEGWLKTSYLTAQMPARDRLVAAEKKIAALEADKQALRQQLAAMGAVEKDRLKVEQELNTLKETAAAPLKLANENREMRQRIELLETESARLLKENERMSGEGQRQWFLTGAGVLIGGIIIGLIAPRFKRRRTSWSSDF